MRTLDMLTERVRAEFMEMPGLRLTIQQVQRLCGIDRGVCQLMLDALIQSAVLRVTPDGYYTRVTEGELPRPGAAKASVSVGARSKQAS